MNAGGEHMAGIEGAGLLPSGDQHVPIAPQALKRPKTVVKHGDLPANKPTGTRFLRVDPLVDPPFPP